MDAFVIQKIKDYIKGSKERGFEGIEILINEDISNNDKLQLKEAFKDEVKVKIKKEHLPAIRERYLKSEAKDVNVLYISWTKYKPLLYLRSSITSLEHILEEPVVERGAVL